MIFINWTDICVKVSIKDLETAGAIAHMAVPYGIYIEDYSQLKQQVEEVAHVNFIDKKLINKPKDTAIIHIYLPPKENPIETIEFLKHQFIFAGIAWEMEIKNIDREDWESAWQKYYRPVHIGKHFYVCPHWEKPNCKPGDIKLILNPGMAFGTGKHESTRMCMELLEDCVTLQSQVLDVGCGSGILSIAALLLGAKKAVGVDVDPLAVKIASENIRLNGISSQRCQFICANLTEKVSKTYDIICANIVADAIIKLCKTVPQFLKDSGRFICSGIIKEREKEVTLVLQKAGFELLSVMQCKEWVAMSCKMVS